jgi:hypothetical protein
MKNFFKTTKIISTSQLVIPYLIFLITAAFSFPQKPQRSSTLLKELNSSFIAVPALKKYNIRGTYPSAFSASP